MRMPGATIIASLVAVAAANASTPGAQREVPPPPIGADSAGMFFVAYPKASLRLNEQGEVHYQLEVDTKGFASSCTVTKSSGYERLDTLTCAAAANNAKFHPATNDSGHPVRTVYNGQVNWSIR